MEICMDGNEILINWKEQMSIEKFIEYVKTKEFVEELRREEEKEYIINFLMESVEDLREYDRVDYGDYYLLDNNIALCVELTEEYECFKNEKNIIKSKKYPSKAICYSLKKINEKDDDIGKWKYCNTRKSTPIMKDYNLEKLEKLTDNILMGYDKIKGKN